MMRDNLKKKL